MALKDSTCKRWLSMAHSLICEECGQGWRIENGSGADTSRELEPRKHTVEIS
ncbi:hypothetical protein IBA8401_24940 [Pseudomonas syringae]